MSQPIEQVDSITPIATFFKPAPGTEILYDQGAREDVELHHLHALQHVKKGDGHILLVPQPSLTDENDPLLWSSWKKRTTFGNGLVYAFLGAVTGPIMAAGMIDLSEFFGESLQKLTYANGATLICQGVATTIWMPFAVKYGRRPVYLLSTVLMGVACVWLGIASTKSYTPFLVGRAFLGMFEAPIESIVPSTITDIYFLHDRGAKISLYGLSVLGGNEIGPMLSAFIIQSLGMNWAFYIVAIFTFTNAVAMFFLMPETKYTGKRPSMMLSALSRKEKILDSKHIEHAVVDEKVPRRSYLSQLKFWSKGDPNISLLKAFLRPLALMAYPTVIFSCLMYGMALSFNVILGATTAQLFAPPPYLFNSSAQGLVFLAPFVGSLFGAYLCGPLADKIANFYTKRNHGIREPEMRLPTCAIAAVLTFLGALMAGLCLDHHTHWAGPIVAYGILSAGAQMGATLSMNYAIDCHKELSVELMVTIASLKSAIAWVWTWCVNDWLTQDGPLVVFSVVASINVVVYLGCFFMYWKGKSIRLWLHERDILGRLGLND